jgi:hypothetical protein
MFYGSTQPGKKPLAVNNGTLNIYTPFAKGLFSIPVASLFDRRQPYRRAADIRLVSAKPANIPVEQLLALTFNPYDAQDRYLYAADSLQLRVVRIDVTTGKRQVIGDDAELFDFPSSMAFLPPALGVSTLLTVSNQQHKNPLTNDAISEDLTTPPYVVAKTYLKN